MAARHEKRGRVRLDESKVGHGSLPQQTDQSWLRVWEEFLKFAGNKILRKNLSSVSAGFSLFSFKVAVFVSDLLNKESRGSKAAPGCCFLGRVE